MDVDVSVTPGYLQDGLAQHEEHSWSQMKLTTPQLM